MKKYWFTLFLASFFEVLWVIGLAHSYNFLTWTLTVILIIVSNVLMIKVAQILPTTTVYTVFVGLGAGGTVVAEILFFGEPFNWLKIFLIHPISIIILMIQISLPTCLLHYKYLRS